MSYNGRKNNWELFNLVNKDRNFVKQLHGNNYEICTVFYSNESMMSDKNDEQIHKIVASNNHDVHDNEKFSEDARYVSYCQKINDCKQYDTHYATAEDKDSEGEDKVFFNIFERKMEPLRVDDIIKYVPPFDIGNTG